MRRAAALFALAACASRSPVTAPAVPIEAAPAALDHADAATTETSRLTLLEPSGGGFSVRMPGEPHEDAVESAPLTMHVFESETADDVVYAVAYTDYPAEFPAAQDPERLLDAARDALLESQGGTLLFEAHISAQSIPGRELTVQRPDGIVTAHLYARGARVFELTVRAKEGAKGARDAQPFFDSFALHE